MYGYLRLIADRDQELESLLVQELIRFAEERGFTMGAIFVDVSGTQPATFNLLMQHLKQDGVAHLAVPSLRHFTRFAALQPMVVQHLEGIGAHVWTVTS